MKHTPGPWRVVDVTSRETMVYRRIDSGSGKLKKHVGFAGAYKMNPQSEAEANARLIAAAPELLEALIRARQDLWDGQPTIAEMVLSAAIAKATGREG